MTDSQNHWLLSSWHGPSSIYKASLTSIHSTSTSHKLLSTSNSTKTIMTSGSSTSSASSLTDGGDVMSSSSTNHRHPRQGHFPTPVRVAQHFHGRRDYLNQLHKSLRSQPPSSSSPAVVCVHGLPGIGKTQLAARYCQLFGAEYSNVFWVASDSRVNALKAFSSLSLGLGLEEAQASPSPEEDQLQNARLLVRWLQTNGNKWLLVLDNVQDVRVSRISACLPAQEEPGTSS
ncbi:hypothetical protein GE09DRAFT_577620 [Coniochaeta sp. 2T2.1]|nr:hypothetical protein GE09DRAFT_577620 [Coniochaeta sp. 2T2.1]